MEWFPTAQVGVDMPLELLQLMPVVRAFFLRVMKTGTVKGAVSLALGMGPILCVLVSVDQLIQLALL